VHAERLSELEPWDSAHLIWPGQTGSAISNRRSTPLISRSFVVPMTPGMWHSAAAVRMLGHKVGPRNCSFDVKKS